MLKALTVLLTQAFLYQGFYVVLAEYWKSRVNNFIIFCTMIGVSAMLYFLRHKVNKLPLFLLAHIALAALCLYTRTPQAVILLVMTVISLIRRLTDRREQPEIYQMVLLCALYIASIHFKLDVARSWIYWMFFGMIPCHIFFHNLDATDQFIRFRRTTTSMDEKKLRHMNLGITTIFTTIVAGILLFAGLSPIDRWAGSLWNLILEGVKAFLRFLASFREEQAPPEILETLEETAVQPGGMPPMEAPETSWLAELLNMIFMIAAYILAIVAAIALIVAVAVYIYKKFYENDNEEYTEERTFLTPFTTKLPKEKAEDTEPLPDRNIRRRIRKLYKKQMAGFWMKDKVRMTRRILKNNHAPVHLTPKEQIAETAYSESEEIRAIYEKARYSANPVTAEDYDRLKQLFMKETVIKS